jgi:hypothetical protein
VAYQ